MSRAYLRECRSFNDMYIDTTMVVHEDLCYAVYKDILDSLEASAKDTDDVYSYDAERFNGNLDAVLLKAREHTLEKEKIDIISDIVLNAMDDMQDDLSWGLTYWKLVDKVYNYIMDTIKEDGGIYGFVFTPKN